MNHLPTLITDLALILACAGAVTLLFRRWKQPVVLGYILAGLLVGPSLDFFPTVGDATSIRTWAEIGVIVLLFAMGLEFSFKKLLQLGKTVAGTAILELGGLFTLGYALGAALGWPPSERLFLGAIVSISSTAIIFRAFDELGLKSRRFTDLVLGVLVVEDLVAILLLVLLPTLATGADVRSTDLALALGKLTLFLVVWFALGMAVLPTVLKRVASGLRGETLLVVSLALCLGLAVASTHLGYSPALGAFALGSLLADTVWGHRMAVEIKPIQNLFGAIFFVSVGMLMDPRVLLEHWPLVLGITALVVVGKITLVSSGALLAGVPLRQALQAGTSMGQIGEFSFIVASLGLTLGVVRPELYPIAVGVSVITSFITPYALKSADPLHRLLVRTLPPNWLNGLEAYSANAQRLDGESKWRDALRFYAQTVLLNGALALVLLLGTDLVLYPWLRSSFAWLGASGWGASAATAGIGLAAAGPFLWALVAKKPGRGATAALWLNPGYSRGPLITAEILRHAVALGLVVLHLQLLFTTWAAAAGGGLIALVAALLLRKRLQNLHQRLEKHFWTNYHEKETLEHQERRAHLSPWDAHLTRFQVPPHAAFVGQTLENLSWREQFGINIAYVERGNRVLYAPARTEPLYPGDTLGIIGTDAQLAELLATWPTAEPTPPEEVAVELLQMVVDDACTLAGQSIRNAQLRERTNGLVVGLERNGERHLNPKSDTVLQRGDLLWIVGDRALLDSFYRR